MENLNTNKNSNKDKGTFIIHINSRENATWQGEALWADQKKEMKFRSALELIKMVEKALDSLEIEYYEREGKADEKK